ncbi:hypothetical protein PEC18_38805 [Paucibacter sp. O1-1]|nr:hypothetical protein [Paucibacter sp. O1-1]MDA3831565.1 hypothetical protein [Paucibacter sp. O1-1]
MSASIRQRLGRCWLFGDKSSPDVEIAHALSTADVDKFVNTASIAGLSA